MYSSMGMGCCPVLEEHGDFGPTKYQDYSYTFDAEGGENSTQEIKGCNSVKSTSYPTVCISWFLYFAEI